MAKIVQFTQFGGPEVLQIIEKYLGKPNAGEVKLAVKAIGLNRAETLLRENRYIFSPELPSRLGYDASAEVIETGSNVSNISVVIESLPFQLSHKLKMVFMEKKL